MTNRVPATAAAFILLLATANASAQQPQPQPQPQGQGGRQGQTIQGTGPNGTIGGLAPPAEGPKLPPPRRPDGSIIIGATATQKGVWNAGAGGLGRAEDIPYQPWARAMRAERARHQLEPHTRCKPGGLARQLLTPYGVEIVELPEIQRVYIFDIGGPHTFRTIYMDGRSHPETLDPTYYGHSVGWWEGDTLVVDTVGFNERFWLDRGLSPHSSQLRTVERFTRTDFSSLRYELTLDDPLTYTKPWTGRFNLRWERDVELFEFICQQANYAHELMVGEYEKVDRTTTIVP